MNCPNKASKFVQDLEISNELNREEKNQIYIQLESKEFKNWYGYKETDSKRKDEGYDTYNFPRLKDNLYITNNIGEKIKLYDLINDKFYEKIKSFDNLQDDLKETIKVIENQNIGLLKRIGTYKGSLYVEKLKKTLEEFNEIEDNNYAKKLNYLSFYVIDTLKQFEIRLQQHEKKNTSKLNEEELKQYKEEHFNFVLQANDFINTFENITKLPKADNFQGNLKKTIQKFNHLESKVTDLKNIVQKEIKGEWNERLKNLSSNPDIINNTIDFLSIQQDEGVMQRYMDAMGDSNNVILANMDKLFKRQLFKSKEEIKTKNKDWDEFCKKYNLKTAQDFEKFLDTNKDLVEEFNYNDFKEEYNKYKQPLNDLLNQGKKFEEDGKTFTKEYLTALNELNKWKRSNIRQPYVKEYYDVLNSLIPEAREAYTEIQNKKQELSSKPLENITLEDNEILKDLDNQIKELKSSFYKNGDKKEGKALEIADSLYKYSKDLGKFFETESINQKAFDKAKEQAKKNGKEKEFLLTNTTEQFSDDFQKKFDSIINKFPKYKELEKIKNKINQLLINYKDFNGVNIEILPSNILEEYKKLKLEKDKINSEIKKNKIDENVKQNFRELVHFVPSIHFLNTKKNKKEDLKNNVITKEEYNNWYNENHEYNEFLEDYVPTSLNTVMRPIDENQIITAPINKWKISRIKAEYHNITGTEPYWKLENGIYEPITNSNGYAFPVNKWRSSKFNSLSVNEQEQLQYIKFFLYDLIKHTNGQKTVNGKTFTINDTIIGKNGLPAIPLTQTKNTKIEKNNEKIVSESGDIVQRLPLHYLKKLGKQTELPKITKDMTKEEVENTNKEIEKIQEQNKQNHLASLNTNLAETMKYFINTAVTNKNKSEMFLMVKATLDNFKTMEIEAKNAKGENIIDKTKSKFKNENVKHTINGLESNAYKHFKDWVEGVYFEEFNLDEGKLSEITQRALTVSSFINIGFNILGGIHNKIVGNVQLAIEAAAGQYVNKKELINARKRYFTGQLNFINDSNKKGASSLDSGFIKYFDVLISKEELGDLPSGKIATDLMKKAISIGFLPQHLGEHQVQNTLLLGMLQSHRIVDGKIISFFDYVNKHDVSADVKKMRKEGQSSETILKFIEDNKKSTKELEQEFEKYEKLEDQFELINREVQLKKGVNLTSEQIGDFKEKVIGVNQKMHGIYNVEDAAMLQRYALGRLGLQFRKWMMPMWNKRFGNQFGKSNWNERRQEYDEGMYITFGKFISSPFIDSYNEYKEDKEKTAIGAFNVLFKGFSSFINNAKINWSSLSMQEKANVKKVCMEMLLIVATLSLGYILKNIGDDDDEKNIFHTWVLNQTNRLYGELTTFNFGVFNEANRLVSNPFAVFKTFDSIKKLTWETMKYPFIEENERIFKSGTYHGRTKASVYLIKNIPLAKNIQDLIYMQDNLERYSNFYGN